MWNYKKTAKFDIGFGYGVLEYDFFTINGEEEFWALIDFYRALWRRFDYFLDDYNTIENNTGLSIHVQEKMREHGANLCLTFWKEESQKNNIKTREMIVNKQKDDGSYDTFVFRFYFLKRNNAKEIVDKALLFSEQKFHNAAIAYFSEAIRLMPEAAFLYVYRGNERSEREDFDSALEDYNKAIELDPKNVAAYTNRGISYGNKRCFGEAIADCSKAIEINPENDWGYLARGYVYQQKGDLENAKADFLKALEISPDNFAAKKALERLPQ
ncbi:hypothetical protein FACS1894137_04530 [Spirochaetia bacterium]|nr:hypothetical protein FACS1894137_04530 [Spirochaetia bacterium]